MRSILLAVAFSAVLAFAATGCEKKKGSEPNTAATGPSSSQYGTTAQAPRQDIDQIRTQADTMSQSQLSAAARQVADDYRNVQSELKTKMDQLKSSGGMIAGSESTQTEINNLRLQAQDLKAKYDVYASKLQEKGISIGSLSAQRTAPSTSTSEANAPAEPNKTGQSSNIDTGATPMGTDANSTSSTSSAMTGGAAGSSPMTTDANSAAAGTDANKPAGPADGNTAPRS